MNLHRALHRVAFTCVRARARVSDFHPAARPARKAARDPARGQAKYGKTAVNAAKKLRSNCVQTAVKLRSKCG